LYLYEVVERGNFGSVGTVTSVFTDKRLLLISNCQIQVKVLLYAGVLEKIVLKIIQKLRQSIHEGPEMVGADNQ
jgi:hypothetical protein